MKKLHINDFMDGKLHIHDVMTEEEINNLTFKDLIEDLEELKKRREKLMKRRERIERLKLKLRKKSKKD